MKNWTPRIRLDLDYSSLTLSGEEGYVLSRIDGSTSSAQISQLTGLPPARVHEILEHLEEQGAISRSPSTSDVVSAQRGGKAPSTPPRPPPGPAAPAPADPGLEPFSSAVFDGLSEDELAELESELAAEPEAPAAAAAAPAPLEAPLSFDEPTELLPPPVGAPAPVPEPLDFDADTEEVPPPLAAQLAEAGSVDPDLHGVDGGGPEAADDETLETADDAELGEPEAPEHDAQDLEGDPGEAASEQGDEDFTDPELDLRSRIDDKDERNYRKYFETQLHQLSRDERADMARRVTGPHLLALCFDPDPGVVANVLENAETGLQHARLIAAHHRNPVGLEALARQTRYLKDAEVQRFLLRNIQCSEAVLRKMMGPKALLRLFQINVGRDLSERAKRVAHQMLRRRFSRAAPEERVALIFKSEGRCLNMLLGLGLDGKTTALLCSRTFNSAMLVQNLLRWPATPPPVLSRIWKQPTVQRNQHLKKMVLRHPNCPTQIKTGKE